MLNKWLKKKGLKAACMAAGLATAWGGGEAEAASNKPFGAVAETYRVSGTITPSRELRSVYVATYFRNGSSERSILHPIGVVVPGQQTTVFQFDVHLWEGFLDEPGISQGYTVYGLYDDASNGVTVGLDQTNGQTAVNNSLTWPQYFGTLSYIPTENQVAGWLRNGDSELTWLLGLGINGYEHFSVGDEFGQALKLVDFSGAVDNGSAFAEIAITPEPMTFLLVGPGLAVFLRPRRPQSK